MMRNILFALLPGMMALPYCGHAQPLNEMQMKAKEMHRGALRLNKATNSSAGKGTAIKRRVIASSFYDATGIQDSTHYYYTGLRGSEMPVLAAYYSLFFQRDDYGNAPYKADSQLVWGVDNGGQFRYDGKSTATYAVANKILNSTTHSTIYPDYYGTDYTYNAAGQVTMLRFYDTVTGGVTTALHPVKDEYFSYDTQGNQVYDSTYDLILHKPFHKSNSTYNSAGNVTLLKSYYFNSLNQWQLADSILLTYYPSNFEKTYEFYIFDMMGVLNYAERDSSGYNGNHPLPVYLHVDEYGNGQNTWRPSFIGRHHLNAAGDNYDTLSYANWDASFNAFIDNQKTVGFFNADGTLSKGVTSFHNNPAQGGIFYYYEPYNDPTAIGNISSAGEASGIYPNPAQSRLQIKSSAAASVIVTDMTGMILLTEALKGNSSVDISRLAAGVYLARITAADGRCVGAYKFLKQ